MVRGGPRNAVTLSTIGGLFTLLAGLSPTSGFLRLVPLGMGLLIMLGSTLLMIMPQRNMLWGVLIVAPAAVHASVLSFMFSGVTRSYLLTGPLAAIIGGVLSLLWKPVKAEPSTTSATD